MICACQIRPSDMTLMRKTQTARARLVCVSRAGRRRVRMSQDILRSPSTLRNCWTEIRKIREARFQVSAKESAIRMPAPNAKNEGEIAQNERERMEGTNSTPRYRGKECAAQWGNWTDCFP